MAERQASIARRAPGRGRQARAGAGDHADRVRRPGRLGAGPRGLSAHRQGPDRRLHRPARSRQEHADRRPDGGAAQGRPRRRRCSRSTPPARSRAAPCSATGSGSPTTSSTPASSSARWRRRGALGGLSEAALQAALVMDAAGKDDVLIETVGRRPGRDRHRRPRRHDRPGADAGLRRLDPGAEGGGDGDPRRDRRQQGRPSDDRHDGARGPRRARAGRDPDGWQVPILRTEAAQGRGGRRAGRARSTSTAPTSRRRARWRSGAPATCATRCSGIAAARLRRRLEATVADDPGVAELLDRVVRRELDPASAAGELLDAPGRCLSRAAGWRCPPAGGGAGWLGHRVDEIGGSSVGRIQGLFVDARAASRLGDRRLGASARLIAIPLAATAPAAPGVWVAHEREVAARPPRSSSRARPLTPRAGAGDLRPLRDPEEHGRAARCRARRLGAVTARRCRGLTSACATLSSRAGARSPSAAPRRCPRRS